MGDDTEIFIFVKKRRRNMKENDFLNRKNSEKRFLGSQEPVYIVRTFECRLYYVLYFFLKPLIYVLKKSQFQKTIYELYLVWKRPSILCLYCANTPYVTGFFAQEKTELKQLWIEFFTRLKFTSFKIFRMEKQIISVDGWWKKYIKTRSLLIIPKEKE